jgi:hypothetical protein
MSLFARACKVIEHLLRGSFVLDIFFNLLLFDFLRGTLIYVWNNRLLAHSKL